MKLNSIAIETDLLLNSYEGKVEYKSDYIVVRTPKRPDYFWGNYILFSKPPINNCYQKWVDLYKKEFKTEKPNFITLTWDTHNELKLNFNEFTKNGFKYDVCNVLSATIDDLIKPEKYNDNLVVRALTGDDWNQYTDVHYNDGWYLSDDSQLGFLEGAKETSKDLVKKGFGERFGAFISDKLFGELGVYKTGVLGRFNSVSTHMDYRRKGVCSTLVYQSSILAFENMNVEKLVIVANKGSVAENIYRSLGFKLVEKQESLEWFDSSVY